MDVDRQGLAPGQMGRTQQPLLTGLLALLHLLLALGTVQWITTQLYFLPWSWLS